MKKFLILMILVIFSPSFTFAEFDSFTATENIDLADIFGVGIATDLIIFSGSTAAEWSVQNGIFSATLEPGSDLKIGSEDLAVKSFIYNLSGVDYCENNVYPGTSRVSASTQNSSAVFMAKASNEECPPMGGAIPIWILNQKNDVATIDTNATTQTFISYSDGASMSENKLLHKDDSGAITKISNNVNLTLSKDPISSRSITLDASQMTSSKVKEVKLNFSTDLLKTFVEENKGEVLKATVEAKPAELKNKTSSALGDRHIIDSNIFSIELNIDDRAVKEFEKPITLSFDIKDTSNINDYKVYFFDETTQSWKLAGDGGKVKGSNITVDINHLTDFAILGLGTPVSDDREIEYSDEEIVVFDDDDDAIVVTDTTATLPTESILNNLYSLKETDALFKTILKDADAVVNSGTDLNTFINYNGLIHDRDAQIRAMNEYANPLAKDFSNFTINNLYSLNNFIVYGTKITSGMTSSERAGVVSSYKQVFGKLPINRKEWADVIRIAGGIWPEEKNLKMEKDALDDFKKIYSRQANLSIPEDSAALTMMVYGLNIEKRMLSNEVTALIVFKDIYRKHPSTPHEWNIVRAIAYSGVKNGRNTEVAKNIEIQKNSTCESYGKIISNLTNGSISREVRSLQEKLQCLGYFPQDQKSTAIFGDVTKNAVIDFQRAMRINETGHVDSATRNALNIL